MENLFSQDYWLLWATLLAGALYFPVRQLIYVLYMRRAYRKGPEPDEQAKTLFKTRAGYTAVLLCFVFSILYTMNLFQVTL